MPRGAWISHVGSADLAHRALASMVFVGVIALAVFARRVDRDARVRRLSIVAVVMVALQAIAGAGLAYGALPPILQIAHVTLGSLLLGVLLLMALLPSRLPAAIGDATEQPAERGDERVATASRPG
jgi:heme A synthase